MPPFRLAPLVVAAMLATLHAAHAQATPDDGPTVVAAIERVQQVQISAHYANAVGTSDAASEGIVRGDRLTDLPLLRPGEVLETIPGLVVTQHSGDGKANQYFLRGYDLDHGTDFASFVDGVPVNMPTNAHGQGYTDLNFLIPELVDRIDYRKGPYFAQEGDFASAGSARIHYVDHLDRGLLSLTAGSDDYRRLLLAGSPALPGANSAGGPRLLGAIELVGDDGPWDTPEGMRKLNGVLRLGAGDRDNGWSIDALGTHSHWTSTDQVPLSLIESGQLGRYAALDPTDGGRSARAVLSGEWHAHDERGYTLASAYAAHNALTLWSNFTFFEERPATGDQFEQQESRNYLGGQLARGWQHTLFGLDSTTEAGLQLRHDRIDVGLFDSQARVVFRTVSNDRVSETAVGAYLQNTTAWTPWLRSLVGLRADDLRMRVDALQTPANSGRRSADRLSPKLSLILGPWAHTEFFANAGRGFHSNDARGAIARVDPTTGDAAAAVPALVPSKGAEIGLRSEIVPGLQTSLALWRLDSDSELVYSADSGSTKANGASRRRGVEWNNHLVLNRWLLVDADMAWTHARYADANANGDAGDRIPNAVGRVGSLGVTLHQLGPWSAGLVTRYIGAYPLSQDGTLTTPSSWTSNLQIRRDLGQRVAVTLDVLNLFDRRFYDIAYEQDYRVAPTAPVVPDGVTVHPGEPREFRVTLSVKL
jgi:outer membrane receptor for monomeric catechols